MILSSCDLNPDPTVLTCSSLNTISVQRCKAAVVLHFIDLHPQLFYRSVNV